MTVLLAEITRLKREVMKWRRRAYEVERSRDMWKLRAMQAERNRPRRRKVVA